MRIVAGEFRGRTIAAPKTTTTRPTTDRVRESLFSSLTSASGTDLGGGAALDAFAGSGALGLEALSRGCRSTVFIESDRQALHALRANVATLRVDDRCRIVSGDAFSLAARLQGGPFALILLDPPYTLDAGRITEMLDTLAGRGAVADQALVCWEHSADRCAEWPKGFVSFTTKRTGTTAVSIARYTSEEGEK